MNHDERCEKILNDAELLARLTDPEPITAEWLESQGWMRDKRTMRIKYSARHICNHLDYKLHIYPAECKGGIAGSIRYEFPIKSRGQLSCLIRGLGGGV